MNERRTVRFLTILWAGAATLAAPRIHAGAAAAGANTAVQGISPTQIILLILVQIALIALVQARYARALNRTADEICAGR